ncbi:hypothetical protein F5B20DRAFT_160940 [Whalleya microplaca]|nr:hypothetical protein F5B20DRAFT_160940 [Whalleya microplaca]
MAASFDPIQNAFDHAVRDFKDSVKDEELYDRILQTRTIDDVYNATDEIQKEQAKNGHLRHLSKIEPYLTRLSDYAHAIEVFVQAKPDVLALIWGPIVLVLQWASVLKTSFDAIIDTTAEIGLALPEFKQASLLFRENDRIRDVLLLFFKDILDFYSIAIRFFRLPRWRYVFESLWPKHRDKIRIIKTHIERQTLLMRRDVQFEHIQQEYEARRHVVEKFEKIEKKQRHQQYYCIKTELAPQNYDANLYQARSRVCEGTEKWLLKDNIFKQWLDTSDKSTRLLWLRGIPGAGKTVLSSIVVDQTRILGRTLFAFLRYNAPTRTALSVLHSFIFQLASEDENLQTIICESSREYMGSNIEVSLKILSDLLACAGSVFIIIDGLDEIHERERNLLLKHLMDVLGKFEELQICISSRPEVDLDTCLSYQAKTIQVNDRNAGSVHTFVKRWTQDWLQKYHVSLQATTEIRRLLADLAWKAKGMFLYAKVVLDSIELLSNISEIEDELRVLPENLDAAYERVLSRINNSPSSSRDKARRFLGWVACAPTPLTVQEIQQALSIREDDREGKLLLRVGLPIDRTCVPIIEVVDDYVQFVHFTVKEYITSPRITGYIDIGASMLSLATCCLEYICQQHHEPDLPQEDIAENILAGRYIFHEYAATTWLELVERCIRLCPNGVPPTSLLRLLERLLEDRSNYNYTGEAKDTPPSKKEALEYTGSEAHGMLGRAAQFRQACLISQYRRQHESAWINLDPLTISQTSVEIYEEVESLVNCQSEGHNGTCDCNNLRRYYGARLFKCSYVHCPMRRQGFETRAARRSHEKYHDRPWKCSYPTCEFADGGFLSRKMRDDHLDRYHQAQETEQIRDLHQLDSDEIQPLLFDLIQANNVAAIRALMPSLKTPELEPEVQDKCFKLAGAYGSPTLFKVLRDLWGSEKMYRGLGSACEHNNVEVVEWIFEQRGVDTARVHWEPFEKALHSDSIEIYKLCLKSLRAPMKKNWGLAEGSTIGQAIIDTSCHPLREQFLIDIWRNGVLGNRTNEENGDTLIVVAKTTRSWRLAKCLVEAGATVDYTTKGRSFTPLRHAARGTSAEAAKLMKFLLRCGADPDHNNRCRVWIDEEEGPKSISNHLGVSWDELVTQIKKEREDANIELGSVQDLANWAAMGLEPVDL